MRLTTRHMLSVLATILTTRFEQQLLAKLSLVTVHICKLFISTSSQKYSSKQFSCTCIAVTNPRNPLPDVPSIQYF